jgi:hypothetical protein
VKEGESMVTIQKKNLIYLYDLPKVEFTSSKLANVLKAAEIDLDVAPEIHRDPAKPFYSGFVTF